MACVLWLSLALAGPAFAVDVRVARLPAVNFQFGMAKVPTRVTVSVASLLPTEAFPPLPMLQKDEFVGESKRSDPVAYLKTLEQRKKYEVFVRDGLFYDSSGKLFAKGKWVNAIFVVDTHGRIYASTDYEKGKFHHSSFLAGRPIMAAGLMDMIQGGIRTLTDYSGHYEPPRQYTRRFTAYLRSHGMDIDDSSTFFYSPPENADDHEPQEVLRSGG